MKTGKIVLTALLFLTLAIAAMAINYPDIHAVPADLSIPPIEPGPP